MTNQETFAHFLRCVEAIKEEGQAEASLVRGVACALAELLKEHGWLRPEHTQGSPDRYRQHIVHVDPEGAFSVVALVWLPGQKTPIHDHVTWCVVGVYTGEEEEIRYRLYEDGDRRFLVPGGRQKTHPGQVTTLIPPEEDIHQVSNVGEGKAISIHVYGADIGNLGSSINRTFDDLPVLPFPGGARRVHWSRPSLPGVA
jgi:predicted metal-dependent enzyme (double-stranded beta helix superfamily)